MSDERFEGRNLSQLLDLMHDIVMPDAVSLQPQTVGWWVLLAWLLAVLVLAGAKWLRKWRRNRYRREAAEMIDGIDPGAAGAGSEIARILKRTALAVYERKEVAALYGADWADFLIKTARNDRQIVRSADQIAAAAYRDDIDASELVKPAKRWIKVHRA